MVDPDAKGLAQAARSRTQQSKVANPTVFSHRIKSPKRLKRADQDSACRLAGEVQAPVDAVGTVDIGTEGHPHVADVCGRIDFVRPDGPNLTDRGVVTAEGLRREYLLENAPDAAKREIEAKYIKGVHEEAPSVMALNMRAASDAVLEWIERQYPYRLDGNTGFARTLFSHAAGEVEFYSDDDFERGPMHDLGRGFVEPLLGLPGLARPDRKDAA